MNAFKIKKGDTVKVITGKDKGKTGKVLRVILSNGRVLVEGINLYQKHVRPRTANEKGQTITVPRSLAISNVQLICSSCGAATRVGFTVANNSKSRTCKKCSSTV